MVAFPKTEKKENNKLNWVACFLQKLYNDEINILGSISCQIFQKHEVNAIIVVAMSNMKAILFGSF